jgi:hypothetical protein
LVWLCSSEVLVTLFDLNEWKNREPSQGSKHDDS